MAIRKQRKWWRERLFRVKIITLNSISTIKVQDLTVIDYFMSKESDKPTRLVRHQEQQQQQQLDLAKYKLSKEAVALFTSLLTQPPRTRTEIPSSDIASLCQRELQRLLQLKNGDKTIQPNTYLDNELTVSLLDIQAKVLLQDGDLQGTATSEVQAEIQKVETEIARFMEAEVVSRGKVDFASCLDFFSAATHRLKELGDSQLPHSMFKLLQIVTFFLRESATQLQPEKELVSEEEMEKVSYEQVNKWSRYRSGILQDKLMELSGICEQIPQLEVFNRTLQFAQLQSSQKVSFLRVIEVLISLHHRVSYLSRNKPVLMKELECASQEITYMNSRVEQFLAQMGEEAQIIPISFAGLDQTWKSQLSESFTQMQSLLVKLSDIIITQDNFHTEHYRKMERLLKIVEMFSEVLAGEPKVVEEWTELLSNIHHQKEDQHFSDEECRLLLLLDDCLACERSRVSSPRQQNLSNRTNEELELEVNKLIEDYERVKRENMQLINDLEMEQRLKEELLVEVDERDNIIKNLSAKKLALEKRAKQESNSVVSSRVKEDDLKKLEHDAQKYLESSLLLKEQLKVSESEREKLLEMAETEKSQYLKTLETLNRLKPERERLDLECEQLRNRIETLKNENVRHANRFNKIITDLTNDKTLLEMQVDTAEKNNLRLMERLELNDKKISEYNKLMMARLEEKDDLTQQKLQREAERLKKELEMSQSELKDLEQENRCLREDMGALKLKIKEEQLKRGDDLEREHLLAELTTKLDKLQTRHNNLAKCLEESKAREDQLEEQLRQSTRTIKEMSSREGDLESEKKRLAKLMEEGKKRCQELEHQLDQLRTWAETETRKARDEASKKEIEMLQKCSSITSLELKIKMLEEQLNSKSQQSEKMSQELVETRMKQFESTIQTHKLIQLKLEEQNQSLKKDLETKMQNEIKLNSEIDRLAKEIDRMKAQLDKYLRELTEKEIIIKFEREKNQEQIKKLRELEVKEKLRKESTPTQEKGVHELDTPSQFEGNEALGDALGRSNLRYDNYFNARQYERLSKEYTDFKKQALLKIDQLEVSLEQARRNAQSSIEDNKLKSLLDQSTKEVENLKKENQYLSQQLKDLPNQLQTLKEQLKNTGIRLDQQSKNYNNLKSEKIVLEEKILGMNKSKESELLEEGLVKQINGLKETNRQLLIQNEQLRKVQNHLKEELQRQTKSMFEHYEGEMKKVIRETDSMNSRLSAEIQSLRKQVASQSTPTQLENEKERMLNQLKRSIESLLTEKNKLIQENSKIAEEKSRLEREKSEISQEMVLLREKIKQVTKERDLIRVQHDSMKIHLEEETKRAIHFQSQLMKVQQQKESQRTSQKGGQNVDFLKAQIKALEEALEAVGAELSDSKIQLEKYQKELEGHRSNNLYNISHENFQKKEIEWKTQEEQYQKIIEGKNRQIVSLKQTLEGGRPHQRYIVTSFPNSSRPSQSTYSESTLPRSMGLIRVDKFLEGKRRWETIQFSESLSRWGVPSVVCQEIEDLRQLFLNMSQSIMTINQEQIQMQKKLMSSVSMENLLELMVRLLTFFSDVPQGSQEAINIRQEVETIAKQNTGGLFFTVLEQYAVHILQNNAIEEYKNELRVKAKELLEIKEKLEELINQQIQQQQHLAARVPLNRPREPGQYVPSSRTGTSAVSMN